LFVGKNFTSFTETIVVCRVISKLTETADSINFLRL